MPSYHQIKSVTQIGIRLGIRRKPREKEEDFRFRVAFAFLNVYGLKNTAIEIASGIRVDDWPKAPRGLLPITIRVFEYAIRERRKLQKDTYSGMAWDEYEKILKDNKFEKVLFYEFRGDFNKNTKDVYSIWIRRDNALLLSAESYSKPEKTVNRTSLHYELQLPVPYDKLDDFQDLSLEGVVSDSSPIVIPDYGNQENAECFLINRSAPEGLVQHLKQLEGSGFKTNNPWKFFEKHSLGFCDYSETKDKKADYNLITQKKIAALPLDVKIMIGAQQNRNYNSNNQV